jgi:hypothetical protein
MRESLQLPSGSITHQRLAILSAHGHVVIDNAHLAHRFISTTPQTAGRSPACNARCRPRYRMRWAGNCESRISLGGCGATNGGCRAHGIACFNRDTDCGRLDRFFRCRRRNVCDNLCAVAENWPADRGHNFLLRNPGLHLQRVAALPPEMVGYRLNREAVEQLSLSA